MPKLNKGKHMKPDHGCSPTYISFVLMRNMLISIIYSVRTDLNGINLYVVWTYVRDYLIYFNLLGLLTHNWAADDPSINMVRVKKRNWNTSLHFNTPHVRICGFCFHHVYHHCIKLMSAMNIQWPVSIRFIVCLFPLRNRHLISSHSSSI